MDGKHYIVWYGGEREGQYDIHKIGRVLGACPSSLDGPYDSKALAMEAAFQKLNQSEKTRATENVASGER